MHSITFMLQLNVSIQCCFITIVFYFLLFVNAFPEDFCAVIILYRLLSRSTDIYNLMSDFIPIYKCLYGVPMHCFYGAGYIFRISRYFYSLDILEYRNDIFSSLHFHLSSVWKRSRAAEMSMLARTEILYFCERPN